MVNINEIVIMKKIKNFFSHDLFLKKFKNPSNMITVNSEFKIVSFIISKNIKKSKIQSCKILFGVLM